MTQKTLLQSAGDGTAIAAGYVGQVVAGASDAATSAPVTLADKIVTTISIPKGSWLITGVVYLDPTGASVARLQASVTTGSTLAGSLGLDSVDGFAYLSSGYVIAQHCFNINISNDTTYNIVVRPTYTGSLGSSSLRAVYRALRIA
jgi:hypothetical protein